MLLLKEENREFVIDLNQLSVLDTFSSRVSNFTVLLSATEAALSLLVT